MPERARYYFANFIKYLLSFYQIEKCHGKKKTENSIIDFLTVCTKQLLQILVLPQLCHASVFTVLL